MTQRRAEAPDPRLELVDTLGMTIVALSASGHIQSACERFNQAVARSDGADSVGALPEFEEAMKPLTTLVKTTNAIDPHILTEKDLRGLGRSTTDELVRTALRKGSLRERRLLIQAAEANTNRTIAQWAVGAIAVNACATIVAGLISAG